MKVRISKSLLFLNELIGYKTLLVSNCGKHKKALFPQTGILGHFCLPSQQIVELDKITEAEIPSANNNGKQAYRNFIKLIIIIYHFPCRVPR